jgi:hypothetical protein
MVGVAMAELPTVLTTAELCERWRCNPRTLERMILLYKSGNQFVEFIAKFGDSF